MPAVTEKALRDIRINRRIDSLYDYAEGVRKSSRVSQAKCGAALGISQGRYSQAITDHSLSLTQLMTVLDFLNVDGADLAYRLVGEHAKAN